MQDIFNVPKSKSKQLGIGNSKVTSLAIIYGKIFEEAKKRVGKDILNLDELTAGWYEIGYKKYGRKKKTRDKIVKQCSLLNSCYKGRKKVLDRVGEGLYKLSK